MKELLSIISICVAALLVLVSLDQFVEPLIWFLGLLVKLVEILKAIIAFPFEKEAHAIFVTAILTALGLFWRTTYQQNLIRQSLGAYAIALQEDFLITYKILQESDRDNSTALGQSLIFALNNIQTFDTNFFTKDVLMLCTYKQIGVALHLSRMLKSINKSIEKDLPEFLERRQEDLHNRNLDLEYWRIMHDCYMSEIKQLETVSKILSLKTPKPIPSF